MTSRERVGLTLEHKQPDKVPVDLGSSLTTGISAFTLKKLRAHFGLTGEIKIVEPFQFLGEVEDDLIEILGIDVVGVRSPVTLFGYSNIKWKDICVKGEVFLIGSNCAISEDDCGNLYMHPMGDINAAPSAIMPQSSCYFDSIVRSKGITDEDNMDAHSDFVNDFEVIDNDIINIIKKQTEHYYNDTNLAINLGSYIASLGDAAVIPGIAQKTTTGIRSMEDWMAAHILYPEYIRDVITLHAECALKSLKKLKDAVGDMPQIVEVSAADFGTQRSEFISPETYRKIYKPVHAKLNGWVHKNTKWKTMFHSCGSIVNLLDDFIDAGVDIINPVQCSAKGMDPGILKKKYGDKLVFWGGVVDTQKTFPFGTAEDVYKEVTERLNIFAPGGGFVVSAVHNIQSNIPVENILAMFDALNDYNNR